MVRDFIAKWNGQRVDFDGVYPNQCMDLMHQYVFECLGITDRRALGAPSAKDVFLNYPNGVADDEYFIRIPNTPDAIPQEGDIIFWGTKIGQYGHVAIFIRGDANNFESFDANWPLESLPHVQEHNYNGVLGWLRRKDDMSQAERDELNNLRVWSKQVMTGNVRLWRRSGEPTVRANYEIPDEGHFNFAGYDWNKVVETPADWPLSPADWANQREFLRADVNGANATNASLVTENTKLKSDYNELFTTIGELRSELEDAKKSLEEVRSELKTAEESAKTSVIEDTPRSEDTPQGLIAKLINLIISKFKK